MDNVTHTLLALALAESGLKRRTALGTATLVAAANLPDVDVLALPFGHGVDVRRGITHGLPAMAVLPVLLVLAIVAWDRVVRRPGPGAAPARPGWVLALALLGTLTHPALDWLNDYGMRWMMPFDGRWSYGDALFIVDPWLLLALLAGVVLSRRRRRSDPADGRAARPARLALLAAAAYVATMLFLGAVGRYVVRRDLLGGVFGVARPRYVVAPRPVNPLDRRVVIDAGDRYVVANLRLRPGGSHLEAEPRELPTQLADSAARAALASPAGRRFAVWARFPFAMVTRSVAGTTVELDDARYSDGPERSFARVTVRFPALHAR